MDYVAKRVNCEIAMNFDAPEVAALEGSGFVGFVPISTLRANRKIVPAVRGVYVLLWTALGEPEFVCVGSGGHFKGKNPNVTIDELKHN